MKQVTVLHLLKTQEFDRLSHLCGSSLIVLYPFYG